MAYHAWIFIAYLPIISTGDNNFVPQASVKHVHKWLCEVAVAPSFFLDDCWTLATS